MPRSSDVVQDRHSYAPPGSWGPVQTIPQGLLSALGLKQFGQNPHALLAEYRPVLEMRDWLLQAIAEQSADFSRAAIVGIGINVTTTPGAFVVPSDQWWYVHAAALLFAPGAGQTVRAALGWRPEGVTRPPYILSDYATAAPNEALSICARQPFWLPPGAELICYVQSNTLTPGFSIDIRYTALRS